MNYPPGKKGVDIISDLTMVFDQRIDICASNIKNQVILSPSLIN
jgi:hypothetical protein